MYEYKVLEPIHESEAGISAIYKIRFTNDDKPFALKVIGPLDNYLSKLMSTITLCINNT